MVEVAPPAPVTEAASAQEQLTVTLKTDSIDTLPPVAQGYRWLTYRGKADVTPCRQHPLLEPARFRHRVHPGGLHA